MATAITRSNEQISRSRIGPLHRQVYDRVQQTIREGHLRGGDRLPSTRALSAELGVSRNTVMAAFEQLIAEGYLEGQAGSGTFVAQGFAHLRADRKAAPAGGGLSIQGTTILRAGQARIASNEPQRPFEPGIPAIDQGLLRLWWRLLNKQWKKARPSLGYQGSLGYMPLRKAISVYLAVARGVHCAPEQVVITSGAQQGLDLAARLLTDPGDSVWVEDPGYLGAKAALAAAGAVIVPIPIDRDGLLVSEGRKRMPAARLAYVTPSHQFPVGATMSLSRRLELLTWARESDAWIVEDDYDSEYRYATAPLPALQALDSDGRVLYVGTFSKTLVPSLRLGYLIVPPALADSARRARAVSDRNAPTLEQALVAGMLDDGSYARHVRRMRLLYAERQAALLAALSAHCARWLEVTPSDAGMHLVAWLPRGVDDQRVSRAAHEAGIDAAPISRLALVPLERGALMLGYAAFTPAALDRAAERLAVVLSRVVSPRR